jgi:hypothetical protein
MSLPPRLLLPALALCCASPWAAAHPQTSILPEAPLGVVELAHGWNPLDGRLLGGGPGYRAELGEHTVTFTPALGAAVEQAQSLVLDLESIGRQQGPARLLDQPVNPVLQGSWAVYDHGQGLRERYEARAGELEQVLELDQPLAGSGDLVVRYALSTPLALDAEQSNGDQLRLVRPAVGGVAIDRLWITDASGRNLGGSLRLTEADGQQRFEIVIPAASLDAAEYPLTIDPAFGPVIEHGGAGDNSNPEVMTLAEFGVTLVAWQTQFALNDIDVRAQRLDFNGQAFGSLITVESGSGVAQRPALASHPAAQRWIVAYERASFFAAKRHIAARSINGSTGAVSPATALTTSTSDNAVPSLGSDRTEQSGVVLAWRQSTAVCAMGLTLDGANLVVPGPIRILDSVGHASAEPRVSGTGGYLGHWCVAWHRIAGFGNNDMAVFAAVVNRNASILVPQTTISSSGFVATDIDRTRPAVDADALSQFVSRFFIAFEIEESASSSLRDVLAITVEYAGTGIFFTGGVPLFELAATPGVDEAGPAVACATTKTYVAYTRQTGEVSYDVHVQGRNTVTATTCEAPFVLASASGETPRDLRLRTLASLPTPTFDRSFLTWTAYQALPPFGGSVLLQPLSTTAGTGTIVSLGGGCGGGGTVEQTIAVGPSIGDSGFGLRNLTADPLSTFAVLNLAAPGTLPIPCGTCQLLPYQITFNVPKEMGGYGLLLGVPCDLNLVGKQLDVQWTVLPTSSSPCALFNNISVSNIARLTIGI